MRFTPEAADGQFVIPVINPSKFSHYTEILCELENQGICAVQAGEEKSPVYSECPGNLSDMFLNDDCSPIYGDWMLPDRDCTPQCVVKTVLKEIRAVHGFSISRTESPTHVRSGAVGMSTGKMQDRIAIRGSENLSLILFGQDNEMLAGQYVQTMRGLSIASRNVRRSIIFLSILGVKFDWDTLQYGDHGVGSICMERDTYSVPVCLMLNMK